MGVTGLIPPPPPPAGRRRWIWWVLGALGAALVGAVSAIAAVRFMDEQEPVRSDGTWLNASERHSTTSTHSPAPPIPSTTTTTATTTTVEPTPTTTTVAPVAPPPTAPAVGVHEPPCPQGQIVVTNARLRTVKAPPDHYGYEERSVQGEVTVVNNTDMAVKVTSIRLGFKTVTGYRNGIYVEPPPHPQDSSWIPPGGAQLQHGSSMLFSDDDLGSITLEGVDIRTVGVIMDWEGGWVTFHCGNLVSVE